MELRHLIAYALMALVVLIGVAVIGYNLYHSNRRTYLRRLRREDRAYAEKLQAKGKASRE